MRTLIKLILCVTIFIGCKVASESQSKNTSLNDLSHVYNFDGNVILSNDRGNNWESLDTLIPKDFNIIASVSNDHHLYLGSNHAEVLIIDLQNRSNYTKENIMATLPNKVPIAANRVTNLMVCKSEVFAFVFGEGLFKKTIGSSNWIPYNTPEGIQNVHQLMEDENGNRYIACPYGVYKTSDQGATWERIFKYGFANNILIIDNNIFVNGVLGLHKSEDQGKTWNKIAIKDWNIMNENDTEISLSIYKDTLLVLRPSKNEMWKPAIKNELVYSVDMGKTWQKHRSNDFLNQQDKVNKVFYARDRMIFITDTKMMYSDDGGNSLVTCMNSPILKDLTFFNVMSYEDRLICFKLKGGC